MMKTLSPTVITLPWRPDAAEHYFAPVNHLPWAMLLHSGDAIHPYNRFDILVADPVTTLTTRAQETTVCTARTTTVTLDDPLHVLQTQLEALPFHPQPDPDLPFQGGALGLFGYDLGRRFEILPDTAARDIALPDMAIGLYDWALIVDHHKQVVSLISYHDADARYRWL
ncbi:aminodeoxychorismate synthase component I, partial [Salmonella enterica subsp. enterica serovar Potsdam]|nr:aminodeoxychorismate synthase component I [Salmonella enterica subsp. enterica serovar Potsdam]